jgi:copper oxidase (laccase) domain-containing protein
MHHVAVEALEACKAALRPGRAIGEVFDAHARVLATVHAGWRGTVARVTERALQTMVAAGADPARVLAGIGPALSFARNQVGQEVVAAARSAFGARADALLAPDPEPGKARFDLQGANAELLRRGGVLDRNIAVADIDTGADGPFYSHRAEQPCGRFALLATMTAWVAAQCFVTTDSM